MNIENIISFVALNQHKNYQRAAEALFITQPSLTYRIKSLENDLGYQLVDRGSHNVKLTGKGKLFLPYAIEISALYTQAKQKLEPSRQAVTISSVRSLSLTILPQVLARFRQRHTTTNISVVTGNTASCLQAVKDGHSQIAIAEQVQDPEVVCVPVFRDEILLCAPPFHPWGAHGEPLRFADIAAEQRGAACNTKANFWPTIEDAFAAQSLRFRPHYDIDSLEGLKSFIMSGSYIGFLPHSAVDAELSAGQLVSIPFEGGDAFRRTICVIHLRDNPPPHVTFVAEQMRAIWKSALSPKRQAVRRKSL